MEKVRWGLLSTAAINRRLIPAIRNSARGVLVAVASRSDSRASAYAKEWDIPLSFGSYQEMLDSGQIDAVYISLPNHLHAEWTIAALHSGVHVLCEKPFALTLSEVDEMIRASHETGRVLTEAFMYRHHPQAKIAGEFVRNGNLGELSHLSGTFSFMTTDSSDVRLAPELGGGCLWDVGVYPLSLAQYLFGEPPTRVLGMQWLGKSAVDETFVGQMRYSGDRFAQISSSFRTQFHIHFEAVGTLGRLVFTRPFTAMEDERRLTFYPNEGAPQEIFVPVEELYLGEVTDMNDAILDGKPPYLSLSETRNHVKTTLALYRSAQTGQPVELDSVV